MGSMGSRAWIPGAELENWAPAPWPSEHTQEGKAQSYQEGGRWINTWMAGRASPIVFFYDWFIGGNDQSEIPSEAKLDETLPVRQPLWVNNSAFSPAAARMTWLGHATVLAEIDGSTVLCDPVFSDRASAVQFVGPLRYRKPACKVKELPKLTAVVVSHNHYDHLDKDSVRKLVQLQPNVSWFVPAGTKSWMTYHAGVPEDKVTELAWWQEATMEGEGGNNLTFVLTPANHWCKRAINDDNTMLWGSWTVLGPTKRFWFGGDTGYCEAFKQIGREYGPFDIAAIPIGAYQPNYFMKYQHVHPGEAVQVHQDINSKKSLGIHWGTFKLTTEYYLEPPVLLTSFMTKAGLDPQAFVTTADIGGSVEG